MFSPVSGEKESCDKCGKLVHPRALKRHYQIVHAKEDQTFTCFMCKTTLKSEMYLKDHLRRRHSVYQSNYK